MKTLEQRFWSKVEKRGPDECWTWVAGKTTNGYGQFGTGGGRDVRAHRFAWELAHGPIPDGICVLHHCDVPVCVNSRHLFLGSNADNSADMVAKGRAADQSGEENGHSQLNLDRVNLILALWRTGMFKQRTIAATIGTSRQNVSRIIIGRLWNVPGVIRA